MSKKKDPAFLFYPSDFMIGTMFFTNEQIGIYLKLLCAQHQHGGEIEKSCFLNMYGGHEIIKSKFVETETGFYNKRLFEEMCARNVKSCNLSANALQRWEKEKQKQSKSNAIASNRHMPIEDENEDIILSVISLFNTITNREIKVTDSRKKLINGRLSEKYSIEDLGLVLSYMHKKWKDDPKMKQFITIETLFAKTNFTKYYEEAKEVPQTHKPTIANNSNPYDKFAYGA